MNRFAMFACAVVTALGFVVPVQAGHKDSCCQPQCCPAPAPTCVEKTITCYRTEWVEKQVTTMETRCVTREVCEDKIVYEGVPEYKTQKRTIYVYKPEVKEIERDVTIAIYAEGCKKPCATGCSGGCGCGYVCDACTKCEPAYKTVRIKQCICVDASVPKEIEEVVCTTKIVEKKVQVKKCITEQVQVPVTKCVRECVKVPYTVTVKVPVCCAPCCN